MTLQKLVKVFLALLVHNVHGLTSVSLFNTAQYLFGSTCSDPSSSGSSNYINDQTSTITAIKLSLSNSVDSNSRLVGINFGVAGTFPTTYPAGIVQCTDYTDQTPFTLAPGAQITAVELHY